MAPEPTHPCDKAQVIDMIVEGQTKIFDKLDGIQSLLAGVSVQKMEIEYLQKDVAAIKLEQGSLSTRVGKLEIKNVSAPKTFMTKALEAAGIAVIVSVVVGTTWLFGYVLYSNIPSYLDVKQNGMKGANSNDRSSQADPTDRH